MRPGERRRARPDRRTETLLLAFIATFPVICEVIDRGPAFTGLRHFLFVVPLFAVFAGIGFDWLLTQLAARRFWRNARLRGDRRVLFWNAGMLVRCIPINIFSTIRWSADWKARPAATSPTTGSTSCRKRSTIWKLMSPRSTRPATARHRYIVAVCGERLPFEKEADAACNGPRTGIKRTSSSRRRT